MLVWLSLAAATTAQSAASDDSLEVALLTCSPGQEVYEYYGHGGVCAAGVFQAGV